MPQMSKEERREYNKKYREKNKERMKEYAKEYRENNKEKKKEYEEKNKEKLVKHKKIHDWKKRGLICEDYDSLYSHYLIATHCDMCDIEFGETGRLADGKCMDHDHDTGLFRNFLCRSCNIKRK